MSINTFPNFSFIGIRDKKEFSDIVSTFKPYSDYVFSSLFSWDVNQTTEICVMKQNLVIKFPDYISTENVYAFFGNHDVENVIRELLTLLTHEAESAKLCLIPEETIDGISFQNDLIINEDRDNYDYVYSSKELVVLEGKKFARKRNLISGFHKDTQKQIKVTAIDFQDKTHLKAIRALNLTWALNRNKSEHETQNEFTAINRMLNHASALGVEGIFVLFQDKPIAYTIYEQISKDFFIGHFEKSDNQFPGAYAFLRHEVSKIALDRGVPFINGEQDLGISSLRQAKQSYHPLHYLKKYKITKKAPS